MLFQILALYRLIIAIGFPLNSFVWLLAFAGKPSAAFSLYGYIESQISLRPFLRFMRRIFRPLLVLVSFLYPAALFFFMTIASNI